MVLNNFKSVCSAGFMKINNDAVYINGQTKAFSAQYIDENFSRTFGISQPNSTQSYIRVGTGNTQPTRADYTLENDVTSSFTFVSGTTLISGHEPYLTNILKNDTENDITITEIAWCMGVYSIGSLIVTRQVLETPITIPVGKSYSFSIHIAL